jgi:septal ring factor EnvC (AmiA/AmiB activator)
VTTVRIDKDLRPLAAEAEAQGWRVEASTTGLVWYAPAGTDPAAPLPSPVYSSRRAPVGRERANLLAELRRAGFRDAGHEHGAANGSEPEPATGTELVAVVASEFVASLAELIEQEYDRRTANLTAQVTDLERQRATLQGELADVRVRLEEAEAGIEERVMDAARLAAQQVLASRRRS